MDACNSYLGAVLIQVNKPIEFASKALDPAQMKYATIEKELLAVCFGCSRFHEYIFGKHVSVHSVAGSYHAKTNT